MPKISKGSGSKLINNFIDCVQIGLNMLLVMPLALLPKSGLRDRLFSGAIKVEFDESVGVSRAQPGKLHGPLLGPGRDDPLQDEPRGPAVLPSAREAHLLQLADVHVVVHRLVEQDLLLQQAAAPLPPAPEGLLDLLLDRDVRRGVLVLVLRSDEEGFLACQPCQQLGVGLLCRRAFTLGLCLALPFWTCLALWRVLNFL